MFRVRRYTKRGLGTGLILLGLMTFLFASGYAPSLAKRTVFTGGLTSVDPLSPSPAAQGDSPLSQCNYCISPGDKSFTHEGGSFTVAVTAPNGCAWAASTDDDFITLTSGSSGAGNGTL